MIMRLQRWLITLSINRLFPYRTSILCSIGISTSKTSSITGMSSVDPGVGNICLIIALYLTNVSPNLNSRMEHNMSIYLRPEWRTILSSAFFYAGMLCISINTKYMGSAVWTWYMEKIYKLWSSFLHTYCDHAQAFVCFSQVFGLRLNLLIYSEYWSGIREMVHHSVVWILEDAYLTAFNGQWGCFGGWFFAFVCLMLDTVLLLHNWTNSLAWCVVNIRFN